VLEDGFAVEKINDIIAADCMTDRLHFTRKGAKKKIGNRHARYKKHS